MRARDVWGYVWLAAIAAAVVAVLALVTLEARECEAGGGVYVRGLWGFECLGSRAGGPRQGGA